MTIEKSNLKIFNVRLTKEMWLFLKNESAKNEIPMTEIITTNLEKYKKSIESKLTYKNTNV